MTTSDAPQLTCPLCACTDFQEEVGRLGSEWGFTSHVLTLMVCVNCRYILHFYDRNSIFNF
ncbi:hypothetical protein Cs7R123_56690 [Catellatospora sp. TT07R-123]|uniref:hypothetical protein n=1 Tax=Catellatospora sp. TT07R-123 TaxID=2733863 RepID=UPI001AFDFB55|nr:hypothetical protein [Catellatospora sp. TT07R-123]GHJ48327.1 hypothetical protein Cs7R123_56690 [Catellatospora sp. TT07R-123]